MSTPVENLTHLAGENLTPGQGDERPQIEVGRLTDDFAAYFQVRGAAPVGSITSGRFTIDVVRVPDGQLALERLESQLIQQGWERAPSRDEFGFGPRIPTPFCRDDVTATIRAIEYGSGEDHLHLTRIAGDATVCDPPERRAALHVSPLPHLEPPRGTTLSDGGSGGTGSTWHAQSHVFTRLDAAALVRHYADQLRRQGWVVSEFGGSDDAAVVRIELVEADSVRWFGFLSAAAASTGDGRSVGLQVSRLRDR